MKNKGKLLLCALPLLCSSLWGLTSCNEEKIDGAVNDYKGNATAKTEWLFGVDNPASSIGGLGDMYLNTSTCDLFQKGDKGWTLVCNIKGKDGTNGVGTPGTSGSDGTNGSSLLTGQGTPSAQLGVNGDSYLNLAKWDYYIKANGEWILQGNIKGGKGEPGDVSLVNSKTIISIDTDFEYEKDGKQYIVMTYHWSDNTTTSSRTLLKTIKSVTMSNLTILANDSVAPYLPVEIEYSDESFVNEYLEVGSDYLENFDYTTPGEYTANGKYYGISFNATITIVDPSEYSFTYSGIENGNIHIGSNEELIVSYTYRKLSKMAHFYYPLKDHQNVVSNLDRNTVGVYNVSATDILDDSRTVNADIEVYNPTVCNISMIDYEPTDEFGDPISVYALSSQGSMTDAEYEAVKEAYYDDIKDALVGTQGNIFYWTAVNGNYEDVLTITADMLGEGKAIDLTKTDFTLLGEAQIELNYALPNQEPYHTTFSINVILNEDLLDDYSGFTYLVVNGNDWLEELTVYKNVNDEYFGVAEALDNESFCSYVNVEFDFVHDLIMVVDPLYHTKLYFSILPNDEIENYHPLNDYDESACFEDGARGIVMTLFVDDVANVNYNSSYYANLADTNFASRGTILVQFEETEDYTLVTCLGATYVLGQEISLKDF